MTKEELEQIEDSVKRMLDLTCEARAQTIEPHTYCYYLGPIDAPKALILSSHDAHTVHQLHMAKQTMLKLIATLKEKLNAA